VRVKSKHVEHCEAHGKCQDQRDDDPPAHDAHGSNSALCLFLSETLFDATGNPLKV
jgi:hypothetical protein